jgi:hypothetical protein
MKTPEELAEDHAFNIFAERYESLVSEDKHVYAEAVNAFLAGYQAAAPKWISVKDRLPEVGERGYSDDVLMLSEHGMEVTHIEKVKRIVKWRGLEEVIETNNGTPIEDFTHWMPLPQPPKEEA